MSEFLSINKKDLGDLLGKGVDGEVYNYNSNRVLKLFTKEKDLHSIQAEYNVALTVFKSGIPTAEPISLVKCDDRFGISFQKIEGLTLDFYIFKYPWKIFTIARKVAKLHVKINCLSMTSGPSMIESLKIKIARTEKVSNEIKEKYITQLDRIGEGKQLCHADLHAKNVIISNGELVVIDWGKARIGYPILDITHAYVLQTNGEIDADAPKISRFLIIFLRRFYLKAYLKQYAKEVGNISFTELKTAVEQFAPPVAVS